MDVVDSLEMRWFYAPEHAVVAELDAWFSGISVESDERNDRYFVDRSRPDLGLKERCEAGKPIRLEIKYRVGTLGRSSLFPGVSGELERWTKLSLCAGAPEIASNARSIELKKSRRLRKFRFTGQAAVEVDATERPELGCGVELTRIEASRANRQVVAVTFGFEAFGPALALLEALQGAARKLFAECPALRLEAECSSSYPLWLATLPVA